MFVNRLKKTAIKMLMAVISLTSYTGPLHCHACGAEYSTAVRNLTQFKIKKT